jgi:hypothetical protein
MARKLGIFFLGLSVGGATFLVAGFAFSLMIAQLKYGTLEARVARAVPEANQVSIRAKDSPVMVNAERYELASDTH